MSKINKSKNCHKIILFRNRDKCQEIASGKGWGKRLLLIALIIYYFGVKKNSVLRKVD